MTEARRGCWWAVLVLCLGSVAALDFVYHDHDNITAFLTNMSQTYPDITDMHSIGKSTQGRDLWVLVVGKNPKEHVPLRPKAKYVGTIHGNEPVGGELMLHLIEFLLTGYGANDTITSFLDSTTLHFLPMMNPDGNANATEGECGGEVGRYNAANVDLNRNFPDFFAKNDVPRQPETQAFMDWVKQEKFILSATFHGGAKVANYPFDNYLHANDPKYSASPDDDVMRHVSLTYSRNHADMHDGIPCTRGSNGFPDGITNGALWYAVTGGVQDYQYVYAGCVDITMELDCCKYPEAAALSKQWDDNRDAMLKFLMLVHMGVKGLVLDKAGQPIPDADLYVEGRDEVHFRSSSHGEFWRLLLPGTYVLHASAPSFQEGAVTAIVQGGEVTIVNIVLSPGPTGTTGHLSIGRRQAMSSTGVVVAVILIYLFEMAVE